MLDDRDYMREPARHSLSLPPLSAWMVVLVGFMLVTPPASLQQKNGDSISAKGGAGDITGQYEIPDPNWPQWAHPYPKPGYIWGSQGGVFAESPNRIYLANRGELKLPEKVPNNFPGNWGFFNQMAATQPIANMVNCIVVVDGNGKLIEAWNQWDKLFEWGRGPHQVYISPYDPQRFVWVVDDMRHVIYRFTHDGKQLVQTLGMLDEFGENDDLTRFRRPTMIDWLPDGTFFVADGYGNTRVVKFDKTGKALLKWGSRGTGPGQFNTPHGIAVDLKGNVYVADRGNNRLQVFDNNLVPKAIYDNIGTSWTVCVSPGPHQYLFSSNSNPNGNTPGSWDNTGEIYKMELDGTVIGKFGHAAKTLGGFQVVHMMDCRNPNEIIVGEIESWRVQKLILQPLPAKTTSAR